MYLSVTNHIPTQINNFRPQNFYQVLKKVEQCKEYRRAFPEGAFGDNDDIPTLLKIIAVVGAGSVADQRDCRVRLNRPLLIAFTMKLR